MSRSETLSNAMYCRGTCFGIALLTLVLGMSVRAGFLPDPPSGASASGTEQNAVARRWFQDARFGLFIHWGVYSLLAKGEWVMDNDKLPIHEYAKLPPRFNPAKFDADAWVKLAKSAGVRYITVTSKHHDGFCMFASKLTDYDIVDATPYHADPLKALADACRDQNIKLFFYYSLLDWHHRDYFPTGKTGKATGREAGGDWKRYVAYYQGQVRELCTNYGEIGGIWFDGWWDRPDADWDLAGTYRLIHELQPGALVGNNHHVAPMPGEDFQMFEQDLPGENAAGFNKAGIAADLPLETCLTINNSWGYNAADTRYKSAEQIIRALVGAAGRGANLLLNVGPRARRHDRPGIPPAVGRRREVAGDLRRFDLRHPPRPDRAAALGRLDRQGLEGSPERDLPAHPQARGADAHHLQRGDGLMDTVSPRERPAAEADAVAGRDGPQPARGRRHADRHHRRAEAPGARPIRW